MSRFQATVTSKRSGLRAFLGFLMIIAASCDLYADSPLTSTPFAQAYQDLKIVKLAGTAQGKLSNKLMKFLCTAGKPLDQKLAVIKFEYMDLYKEEC